jgi:hypothetical protein
MKASQRALLAALGIILLAMIATMAWVRFGVTQGPVLTGARASLSPALTGFDAIAASGQWRVTVTRGASWRVDLDVPTELEPYLEARVVADRLELGLKPGLWLRGFDRAQMSADVTMPQLRSLVLSGPARVDLTGFDGERLEIGASGAAKITAHTSRFDALALTISGAVAADLSDATFTDADVRASGATNVKLTLAGGRLTGSLSGAGHLEYAGTVSGQDVSTSGAVRVEHVQ